MTGLAWRVWFLGARWRKISLDRHVVFDYCRADGRHRDGVRQSGAAVNLHERIYGTRGGHVEEVLRVEG